MKNVDIARKYEDYIIAQRRYFHENPELSGKEYDTVKKIASELDSMGIPYVEIEEGGILATIRGCRDNGRAVLLRADIDALAVTETDENLKFKRTCKSKNDGVMHACGHDGHTAMLLGAARILLEKREELEGTVYLCFERGEEGGGNGCFILKYLDDNKIHIDTVYAMHLFSKIDSGKLAINDGPMMASMMVFGVTIEGKGGHGSRPDLSSSPIDAFVAIYNGLSAMRLTKIDPYKSLTYSIGSVKAGDAHNIIPQSLSFKGTMRTFDRDGAGMTFHREMKRLIDGVCELYGCRAVYEKYTEPGIPVINDTECAVFARDVLGAELGRDNIINAEPWMASEPFSQFLYMWPGVFAFLGVKNEEKGIGAEHHNPYFDIDEDVLYKGSAAAATYAIEFLKSDIDTSDRKFKGGYREVLLKSERAEKYDLLYRKE